MGTALTGLEIKDTYDSLIKVTDNGPLSGTLKALSDGLGNDSTLSLSTTAASIAGTLAVTGNATFDTTTLFVDAANNRVGVGSITPSHVLDIQSTAATLRIRNTTAPATGGTSSLLFEGINNFSGVSQSFINSIQAGNSGTTQLAFGTSGTVDATATERMRITSTGNVGIGTTAPTALLHLEKASQDNVLAVVGQDGYEGALFLSGAGSGKDANITVGNSRSLVFYSTANSTPAARGTKILTIDSQGIKFGTDTAAANALDDYEEGTWTMGVSFGGASVGVTTSVSTGTYTKIGRQVTVNGLLILTSKGSSTGSAKITGLPFTIVNSTANYTAASLRLTNINFTDQFQGYGDINTTIIALEEVTMLGAVTDLTNADFANNSAALVSLTYFV